MLPIVTTYSVAAGNATTIVNANAATSGLLVLATTATPGANQMRLLVTSSGNDSALFFHIIGTNQAGFPIAEFLAGSNATTAQSNLDFNSIKSIQPSGSSTAQTLGTTAATVSVGVNGVGSSMWNVMNWHADPTNISISAIVTSVNTAVNYSVQYTYDDPNNLPGGVTFPAVFSHAVLANMTASGDGQFTGPISAARFLVNSGTGTIRGTFIQSGIGTP